MPAALDVAAETDQVVGPLYYRALVTGERSQDAFVEQIVTAFAERHGLAARTDDDAEDGTRA